MNQPVVTQEQAATAAESLPTRRRPVRAVLHHPVTVHLAVLLGYLAVGVAVTWPHATYLVDNKVPATLDGGSYVWGFWWVARCVEHLSNPWITTYMAAPVGTELGLHTLMPLAGVVFMPVTILFGPSASYNLMSVALPGLLAYAMYRAARLWLPSQVGAIAAGGFFGFSAILAWQDWVHLNLAAGALLLPIALEGAVRLRRRPGLRQAVILGVILGASVLMDQESAVLTIIVATAALLPWVLARLWPVWRVPARLWPVGVAVLVTGVVASPQILAIAHEAAVGGPSPRPSVTNYLSGIRLPGMFMPSPRVAEWGLSIAHSPGWSTYGSVLTGLALLGLILAWRRLNAWLLALLWLASAALALGAVLYVGKHTYIPLARTWDGVQVSNLLPYTWFVRLPGLDGFREPSRIAELGLVPAALLAGYAVNWFRYHAAPLVITAFALGLLEAGMTAPPAPTMPAAMPVLDAPIAADHSGSIVVDVPFGIRGGVGITGLPFSPETLVLATADGHPRADAYLSRIPPMTNTEIGLEPFYHDLISTQTGHYQFTHAEFQAAANNAQTMKVGWVLLWTPNLRLENYLTTTGFRLDYQVDGVLVYRPAADLPLTPPAISG